MTPIILFITNSDWFFISHRLPIAQKLIELGFQVHLATNFTNNKEKLEALGLRTHAIRLSRRGIHPLQEISTILEIRKILNEICPSIVHGITLKSAIYGGLACRLAGISAYVASIAGLGSAFSGEGAKNKLLKKIISILFRFSLSHKKTIIIFQNKEDKSALLNITSLKDNQTELIEGSGVDLNKYCFKEEPKGNLVVTMASRLIFEKGIREFLEAARILKQEGIDAEFWLVGTIDPGNPSSATESDLQTWKEEGLVKLLGLRKDIDIIFSQSNIIVLPSYYGEGLPKVLLEAGASGRAIITTDNQGCRDAIIPDVTGILIPKRDAIKLAANIKLLLQNEDLRKNMGCAGRKLAENKFGIEKVVQKHVEIYTSLLS